MIFIFNIDFYLTIKLFNKSFFKRMLTPYLSHLRQNYNIVLGSQSKNRLQILQQTGLGLSDFSVQPSNFKENLPKTKPESYVRETAYHKLQDLKDQFIQNLNQQTSLENQKSYIIITCDTIISHKEKILEKAETPQQAKEMISSLLGQQHEVLSHLHIGIYGKHKTLELEKQNKTKVYFKSIRKEQIDSYIETEEWRDKAGCYGIQGQAGAWIEKIEGDYYGVWGMGLSDLVQLIVDGVEQFEQKQMTVQ